MMKKPGGSVVIVFRSAYFMELKIPVESGV